MVHQVIVTNNGEKTTQVNRNGKVISTHSRNLSRAQMANIATLMNFDNNVELVSAEFLKLNE